MCMEQGSAGVRR